MWLDLPTLNTVVASTPLVVIDLVVRNSRGDVLLCLRVNRPAYGFWFVPRGRIQKNESFDIAFRRISREELGRTFERADARLLGVFEQFYDDSFFANAGLGPDTHYVVLSYCLQLADGETLQPPTEQHQQYRWWPQDELRFSLRVHENTRAYSEYGRDPGRRFGVAPVAAVSAVGSASERCAPVDAAADHQAS